MTTSVLVVEDDEDMRLSLTEMLREEGYDVDAAPNGLEGLRILRTRVRNVDLILLDLMMPVMNGWQFRREQEKDPTLGPIPVVVLSAGSHVAEAAASIGAAGFLRKPIRLKDLLTTIEHHSSRRALP